MVCGDGLNYAAPAKFRVALNVIISTPAVSFCSIPFDRACAMLDRKNLHFYAPPSAPCPRFSHRVASILITRRRNSISPSLSLSLQRVQQKVFGLLCAWSRNRVEERGEEGEGEKGNGRCRVTKIRINLHNGAWYKRVSRFMQINSMG